jgi:hypothetical protein
VGRPKGNNRPTRSGRRSGAGRGQRARTQVRARASVSGCRIRHRAPPALPRAQAKRGASEGWSTRARRKTRTGSCSERRGAPYRRKTSRIVASHSLHGGRWKRSRSTEHHASRPVNGGGVTSGVTRRQRRSRVWQRDSVRGSGVERTPATRREGEKNLLVATRPAEAGPARRETTDPSIAPLARADQAGRKPRARVQVRQVVVGRSRSDTSRGSRGNRGFLARGRSASRERARWHERGRNGVQAPRGIFHRTPWGTRSTRENASGPDTTEGVLNRSSARSSPGVREAVLARR